MILSFFLLIGCQSLKYNGHWVACDWKNVFPAWALLVPAMEKGVTPHDAHPLLISADAAFCATS